MTIQNHYPAPDLDLQLEDGLASRTANGFGTVGGVAKILDLGADDVREANAPGEGAFARGDVVFNFSAIDNTTGDETVVYDIEFSTVETFLSDVVQGGQMRLGAGGGGIFADKYALGQHVLPFTNEIAGKTYRFMRLKHTVGGTTPSFTAIAYVHKQARAGR